jgi:hypothetical protein
MRLKGKMYGHKIRVSFPLQLLFENKCLVLTSIYVLTLEIWTKKLV